jgi:hypothetical protein
MFIEYASSDFGRSDLDEGLVYILNAEEGVRYSEHASWKSGLDPNIRRQPVEAVEIPTLIDAVASSVALPL